MTAKQIRLCIPSPEDPERADAYVACYFMETKGKEE